MRYFLIVIFVALVISLSSAGAQEQTIALDISVTNPSDTEAQEVEVKVDLPKELKEEDIISSDGLKPEFNPKKGCLFVEGRILLQPAETAFYKIVVRDVWVIPEEEISALRSALGALRFTQEAQDAQRKTQDAINRLDKVLSSQRESISDIGASIAAHRENKKELEEVRSALWAIRQELEFAAQSARRKAQTAILFGILTVFLGLVVFLGLKKREYLAYIRNKLRELGIGERRRFVRLPNQAEVEYRLLPEEKINPSIPVRNISKGGVSFSLDKAYSPNSVIELRVKLPSYAENLIFRGFVVWQKKVTSRDRKEYYLTGISFGETDEKNYQKLEEFVSQRRSRLSRLVRRSD